MFLNVGVGFNYVGHVIFGATWAWCNFDFIDDQFKTRQGGMRTKKLNRQELIKPASFLFTSAMMVKVVAFFDTLGEDEVAMLEVQSWQTFCGFQSEGVPALTENWSQALALEQGVDSAVWVDRVLHTTGWR